MSDRAAHEIDHGRWLAAGAPEEIWGWGTPAGRVRATRRAQLIAEAAGLVPGCHALEIGCGTGLFTSYFAESGARVLAVDISRELIELADKRGLPADRVRFLVRRFEECALDGPCDAVIGSSVLHHIEVAVALPRIYSLLRPGGRMAFAEPNMLNPQIAVQKNVPMIKRWLGDSPDETAFIRWRLRRLLSRCGFVGISITPFDWLHPSTPRPLIDAVSGVGRLFERVPIVREFAGSLVIAALRPHEDRR